MIAAAPEACAAGDDRQTGGEQCAANPPGFGHPSTNATPVILQLAQPSVEPVAATDGLIHLAYVVQATNTGMERADIVSVVPVDPLADFSPTGHNFITDPQGHDVAGKVQLFARSSLDTEPEDGVQPATQSPPGFTARVPAGSAGLMYFDVTYTDPALIPRLLAHAITLALPNGGAPSTGLTNPVPVGCKALAVLSPPLVGHGWVAANGCCSIAAYHRTAVAPANGTLLTPEQFAIDFVQLGKNGTCCDGPSTVLTNWLGYNAPVLAAAHGVVTEVVDGLPDQPVEGMPNEPIADQPGNHVVEDISGRRFVTYAHLKPGSIPKWVSVGARLRPGQRIGNLGNSGNSTVPHLHFQVQDSPSPLDSAGLPFVFAAQVLEGSVAEGFTTAFSMGAPVSVDRTQTGARRNQMPARNGVFSYNPSQ
ncbi:MAG: M23 family metallopeptidase [Alphaproteobacteria bacterium]|nr:M23 family metallopeptidase [Alphaproteobacteria bacterium]